MLQTFVDRSTLFQCRRKPDWLEAPVGPDVSPDFTWITVVTFLQLGIDIMLATTPPLG
jgi:uncharacterized membrane protein